MNVNKLLIKLQELATQGYGNHEIVAYIQLEGNPLEVIEITYDEKLEEVSIVLDF